MGTQEKVLLRTVKCGQEVWNKCPPDILPDLNHPMVLPMVDGPVDQYKFGTDWRKLSKAFRMCLAMKVCLLQG